MAQVARRNDGGTGTRPASQPSAPIGDQLQYSQSTERLLNDIFQELLPQRREMKKSSNGGGGLDRRGVGKGEKKMTSEEMRSRLEAEITGVSAFFQLTRTIGILRDLVLYIHRIIFACGQN